MAKIDKDKDKVKSGSANDILNKAIKKGMENPAVANDMALMSDVWEKINSKSEDGEEGLEEYEKVCNVFGLRIGELVYFKGVKAYPVVHDGFTYELGENSYGKDILMSLFQGKTKYEKFIRFMLKRYNLKNKPHLRKMAYIVHAANNKEGYIFRKDLEPLKDNFEQWTKRASTIATTLNKGTSSYMAYIPTIKIRKANNELMNELLSIIFRENDIDVKRFLGLYAFENRYEISRPSLILWGIRGAGKGIFTESLLAKIYEGMSSSMSTSDQFNDFLDNKLIFLDETTENRYDTSLMYDTLKQFSGQSRMLINTKNQKKFQIKNGVYAVVMSNDVKPLHIKDEILSDRYNQFLVLTMKRDSQSEERVTMLEDNIRRMGYKGFNDFIEDSLGHYIYTELFDTYKAMRKLIKGKPYRYGMPVPITTGLKQLMGMSVSENDMASMRIIENLYFKNRAKYNAILQADQTDLFDYFSDGIPSVNLKGFLGFEVLRQMLVYEKIKVSAFKRFITTNGFVISGNFRIQPFISKNKFSSEQGFVLDIPVIEKFLNKELVKSQIEMGSEFKIQSDPEIARQEQNSEFIAGEMEKYEEETIPLEVDAQNELDLKEETPKPNKDEANEEAMNVIDSLLG